MAAADEQALLEIEQVDKDLGADIRLTRKICTALTYMGTGDAMRFRALVFETVREDRRLRPL